jgi:hypothetical protein
MLPALRFQFLAHLVGIEATSRKSDASALVATNLNENHGRPPFSDCLLLSLLNPWSGASAFATAPSHGQGLFVISEDIAPPSAEAALVLTSAHWIPAPIAVGAGHPASRYRRHTDRIRSKYRPMWGGGNIGQGEGGRRLDSPLDSPLPTCACTGWARLRLGLDGPPVASALHAPRRLRLDPEAVDPPPFSIAEGTPYQRRPDVERAIFPASCAHGPARAPGHGATSR